MGIELLNQIIRLADEHNQGRFRLEKDKEGKEKVGVYGNKGWFGKFRVALRNKNKMEAERVELNTALDKSLYFDGKKKLFKNFLDENKKFLDCKTIHERVIKITSPKEDKSSLYDIINLTKKTLTAKGRCQSLCDEYLRENDLPLPGNQVKSGKGKLKKMTPEEIEKLERFPLGHLGYKFKKNYILTNTILVAMTQEEIDNYHQVKDRIGPLSGKEIKEREVIVKQFPYGDYGVKLVEKEENQNQQKVICVDLAKMTGDEIKEYEKYPLGPWGYKFAEPDWDGKTYQEIENESWEIKERYPYGDYGRKSDKDGRAVQMSQDEKKDYNEKTQRLRKHRAWHRVEKRVIKNSKTIEEYKQINKQFPSLQDGWADLNIDKQKVNEYNEKEARFLNLCRFDRSKEMEGLNSLSPMDDNEKKEYLERFPEFQKLILKGEKIQSDENVIEKYMAIKKQYPEGNTGVKWVQAENSDFDDLERMTEVEIKDYNEKRERFLRYQAQEEMGIVPMNETEIKEYKDRKKRFPLGDSRLKSEIIYYPDPTRKQLGLEEFKKMQKAISENQTTASWFSNCPVPYYDILVLDPDEKKEYQEAMKDPIIPCPGPKYRGCKIVYENTPKEAKDSKNDDHIDQITRIQSSWGELQEFGSVNEINYRKRLQRVCRKLDYKDIPEGLVNNSGKWKELRDQIIKNIKSESRKVFLAAHTNFIEHNFVAPPNSIARKIIGDTKDEESFKDGRAYYLSSRRVKEIAEETIRNFLIESDPEKKKIVEEIRKAIKDGFTPIGREEISLTGENQWIDAIENWKSPDTIVANEISDKELDTQSNPNINNNNNNGYNDELDIESDGINSSDILNPPKEVANPLINIDINEILNGVIEKYHINPDEKTKGILRENLMRELSSDNEQGRVISNEVKAEKVICAHYLSFFGESLWTRLPERSPNTAITKDIFSWESFLEVWNSSSNQTKGIDDSKRYKIFEKVCNHLEKEGANQQEITKDWADKVSQGLIEKYAEAFESIDNYMRDFDTLIKEPIKNSISEDATAINYFNRINWDALKEQFQKKFDIYLYHGDKLSAAKNLKEDIDKIVQQEIDRLAGLLKQRENKKTGILTQIRNYYSYYNEANYYLYSKIKSTIDTKLKDIDNVLKVGKQTQHFDSGLVINERPKQIIWNEVVWNIMAESSLDGETLDQLEVSEELAWNIAYKTINR